MTLKAYDLLFSAPQKKQKRSFWCARIYKQATPPGLGTDASRTQLKQAKQGIMRKVPQA